jgi:hypothetical protein
MPPMSVAARSAAQRVDDDQRPLVGDDLHRQAGRAVGEEHVAGLSKVTHGS